MNTKKLLSYGLLVALLALGAACSGSGSSESVSDSLSSDTSTVAREGYDFLVTISTDYGDMKAILHDLTPQHKKNFIKLAKEGFYDELMFHRVMQDFMIQGGDPLSKFATAETQTLGTGGPGYEIPAEIRPELFHKKGAIAAARTPNREKRSSGSQFYIIQGFKLNEAQLQFNEVSLSKAVGTLMRQFPKDSLSLALREAFNNGGQQAYLNKCMELSDAITAKTDINFKFTDEQKEAYTTLGGRPDLDNEYTVFGQVLEGLEVIDKIAAVATNQSDRPLQDVRMNIKVEELPKTEIAKTYDYTYF